MRHVCGGTTWVPLVRSLASRLGTRSSETLVAPCAHFSEAWSPPDRGWANRWYLRRGRSRQLFNGLIPPGDPRRLWLRSLCPYSVGSDVHVVQQRIRRH